MMHGVARGFSPANGARTGLKPLATAFFILFLLVACGGAGTPPASIPAPVTQLLTISEPGPTGAIQIQGQPGAVQPGANVQARNATEVGPFTWLRELLLRSAHAQVFNTEVTADDQGAFSLLIDGASGDTIEIRQEIGGEFSDPVALTVP